MTRDQIINKVIEVEGGYSNNPNDSGGATKYGITEAVARQYGYAFMMQNLDLDTAREIYRKKYWNPLRLDDIIKRSCLVAEEMFDTGVNQGIGKAAEYLQRSLNVLNRGGKDYPDLLIDKSIGNKTVEAYNAFMNVRGSLGELALCRALNGWQCVYYMELGEKRPKDEDFMFGWLINRIS